MTADAKAGGANAPLRATPEDVPYLVDSAGRRFPLGAPLTLVGRSPDCQVHIADRRASRRHAQIVRDGEACSLHHLSATNATLLNGRCLMEPQILRDGDEIAIASATLTFRDPSATQRMSAFPLLVVDGATGEVWVNRQPVSLSPKEQALFAFLYRRRGRVCGKQELAAAVWPEYRAEVYDYQIESLVKRLRAKLEADPHHPVLLTTERGFGYRLDLPR